MITRTELRSIPELNRQIRRDKEQLMYLQEKATALPPTMSEHERVQTSHTNNSNRSVDAAVDLSREINARERELDVLTTKATEFIESLPDTSRTEILQKKIMRYRFCDCLMWREISDLLGYDAIYIQRLAKSAETILPE